MTYPSTSSAEFFSHEEREEMRFLRRLKGVLREAIASVQEQEALTQEEMANKLGFDPAQLSRILSADRHNSTSTLFRAMHRLGRRWKFGSEIITDRAAANQPSGQVADGQRQPQVSVLFTTMDGASVRPGGAVLTTTTQVVHKQNGATMVAA